MLAEEEAAKQAVASNRSPPRASRQPPAESRAGRRKPDVGSCKNKLLGMFGG